ncbi:MAG TPA: putative DNA modification/repair radical SAM protein [Nitrospiraceae bacterium]|nr:putative DNA modification/repair radical SAM protein [Nitrospiraceae bacterium]
MDRNTKLRILADSAKYDASCASSGSKRAGIGLGVGHSDGTGICHSYTPDGRCVSLLKILLTNYCVYDCVFCVNRASSDIPRARFTSEEVVTLTLDFYRRNYIEGLFLSSGIFVSPDHTMEEMVRVARTLREVHHFGGYIHLKTIPGAAKALIEDAGRWADRVSVNIELPTQAELDQLAPEKQSSVIETAMGQIHERVREARAESSSRHAPRFAPAGQTTQMVIGATAGTDAQILATATKLYDAYGLRRVYYSGFSPYPKADARLPLNPTPLVREHRLYQADWLMRYYGFRADELTTVAEADLNLSRDPKLQWALRHREFFPIDINAAPREALLRIPGLGYKNVSRVLAIRRYHRLTLADLAKLHVPLRRLSPFVITADFHADAARLDRQNLAEQVTAPRQLALFTAPLEAQTGQL